MPSQKATAAEWGVKNGRMATGVGCKDPTMAACTPPETRQKLHVRVFEVYSAF
jgi:hypothetical protein